MKNAFSHKTKFFEIIFFTSGFTSQFDLVMKILIDI